MGPRSYDVVRLCLRCVYTEPFRIDSHPAVGAAPGCHARSDPVAVYGLVPAMINPHSAAIPQESAEMRQSRTERDRCPCQ
jgi:hypothetical protein